MSEWDSKRQMEAVDEFAYPLPAIVIATMIGAPLEDVHLFHVWADTLTNLLHGGVGASDRLTRAQTAVEEFNVYLSGIYRQRLTNPRADMMSWLMEAQA